MILVQAQSIEHWRLSAAGKDEQNRAFLLPLLAIQSVPPTKGHRDEELARKLVT